MSPSAVTRPRSTDATGFASPRTSRSNISLSVCSAASALTFLLETEMLPLSTVRSQCSVALPRSRSIRMVAVTFPSGRPRLPESLEEIGRWVRHCHCSSPLPFSALPRRYMSVAWAPPMPAAWIVRLAATNAPSCSQTQHLLKEPKYTARIRLATSRRLQLHVTQIG